MINGPNQRPKKFFEIAKSASTSEERDTFADAARQKFAIDAEACLKPLDEQSHPKDKRSDPKKPTWNLSSAKASCVRKYS
jgi:hypothetical protein